MILHKQLYFKMFEKKLYGILHGIVVNKNNVLTEKCFGNILAQKSNLFIEIKSDYSPSLLTKNYSGFFMYDFILKKVKTCFVTHLFTLYIKKR